MYFNNTLVTYNKLLYNTIIRVGIKSLHQVILAFHRRSTKMNNQSNLDNEIGKASEMEKINIKNRIVALQKKTDDYRLLREELP